MHFAKIADDPQRHLLLPMFPIYRASESCVSGGHTGQDPKLLRRLLRAKDHLSYIVASVVTVPIGGHGL